ncbi:MAG: AbiEi antitoxin N-terminal domain-containing protein [Gammaproteobacteria bacterium]|nr:AbiEi antitoxin N-terminal domain-containing protein [Gammaproteobacteria bacterium]
MQCWLSSLGVDRRLADKYAQSGWLERLGHGAINGPVQRSTGPVAQSTRFLRKPSSASPVHPGESPRLSCAATRNTWRLSTRGCPIRTSPARSCQPGSEVHPGPEPVTLVTTRVRGYRKGHVHTSGRRGRPRGRDTRAGGFEMPYPCAATVILRRGIPFMESLTS